MSAEEFLAALNTVEQDHQLVLDKVRALKEAANSLLVPADPAPRQALDRLRELNDYFSTQLACHMDEEEITLFPLMERHAAEGLARVAGLRREHAEIRRKLEEFSNCLDVAGQLSEGLPRPVRRDLLVYSWDLWEALDVHAYRETEAIRECILQALPAS
jgi:hemerythrin-like domain-containing protein